MEMDQTLKYVIQWLWTFYTISFIPYDSNYLALKELNSQMPSLMINEDWPVKVLHWNIHTAIVIMQTKH